MISARIGKLKENFIDWRNEKYALN